MSDVLILTNSAGRSAENYHTDGDCRVAPAPRKRKWISQEEADRRGLEECDVCSGEYEPHRESDPMKWHKKAEELSNA